MFGYDPSLYNYANLKKEDKSRVDAMVLMFQTTMNMEFGLQESTDPLTKVLVDTANEVKEEIKTAQMKTIVKFIASQIQGYTEPVPARPTSQHFYGM